MQNINHSAPVKCTKTILINASSVDVWDVITAINDWAKWHHGIKMAKLNGPLQPGTSFVWKAGLFKIRSILHTVDPYTDFGWSGKALGLFAIHNWKIKELNKNVEVTVEESMEGLIAKLFRKSLGKNLDNNVTEWLEMLKKKCESVDQ